MGCTVIATVVPTGTSAPAAGACAITMANFRAVGGWSCTRRPAQAAWSTASCTSMPTSTGTDTVAGAVVGYGAAQSTVKDGAWGKAVSGASGGPPTKR